ncbi:MAG TPA: hypothetical protein VFS07_08040 [Gemmatimonadales bacterium]|nr:hypothetical protein [Gemmatimonadales bacterium]
MRVWSVLLSTLLLPAAAGAQEVALVAPGRGFDPARFRPFTDTVTLSWVQDGALRAGPLQIEAAWRGTRDGRAAIVHRIRVESPRGAMDDTTWYDPTTFAPLAHRSHGPRTITLDYAAGRVRGVVVDPDRTRHDVDTALAEPAFDPSAIHTVFRAIPWRPGYAADVAFFSHEALGVARRRVEVVGADTLATVRGPVPAWRVAVHFDDRVITYWLSQRDGADLKVETEVRPGVVMRGTQGGVR